MPKRKDDTTIRKQWDSKNMELAVQEVSDKRVGFLKRAKTLGLPKSTLLTEISSEPSTATSKSLGRKPVLSPELEEELVRYLLQMESLYYGVTRLNIRTKAYQLTTRNHIKQPFENG